MLEDPPRAVIGDQDRDAEPGHVLEERVGGAGIELGGRLVEQQQLRPQRDGGREADTLQLSPGELGDGAIGEVLGADRGERLVRATDDLLCRGPDVLEPEGDLADDAREDDLFLRVLEDAGHRPGELGRAHGPRVEAGDLDAPFEAPAVKVRNEPCEGAQQRRLARAGWTEHGDDLARFDLQGDVAKRRGAGLRVGEREPVGAR